jgi:RloB-like protein
VCGSEGNEARYVKGLNKFLQNAAVSVTVAEKGCAPSQVVEYGVKKANSSAGPFDELWCVVDVDDFGADGDLSRACALAAKETCEDLAVTLVVSNPCFELWLILHFADHRAHIASFTQIKPVLHKAMPKYSKDKLDFVRDGYAAAYGEAVARAKSLEPKGTNYQINPSTNMWRLVEAMSS